MSGGVITKAVVTVSGTDVSASIKSIDPKFGTDPLDNTTMPDSTKTSASGLITHSLSFSGLLPPDGISSLRALIWTAISTNTPLAVTVLLNGATVSATNPKYSSTYIPDFSVSGQTGQLISYSLNLTAASPLIVTTT